MGHQCKHRLELAHCHWNVFCERRGQDETNFISDPVKLHESTNVAAVLAALPEAEPDGSGVTVLWL